MIRAPLLTQLGDVFRLPVRAICRPLNERLVKLRAGRVAAVKLTLGVTGRTGNQQPRRLAPLDGLKNVVFDRLGLVHDDEQGRVRIAVMPFKLAGVVGRESFPKTVD